MLAIHGVQARASDVYWGDVWKSQDFGTENDHTERAASSTMSLPVGGGNRVPNRLVECAHTYPDLIAWE